jgi:uncharacterized protein (DUF58 family)
MSSIQWQFPSLARRFRPASVRSAVRKKVGNWARNRQGADSRSIQLSSRRVYILPTGIGLIYALMTFAMLLGSMNYNNNLSFVLTFLLVSLGLVAMHQCQRNLVGLEISFAGVEPVFAGQSAEFRIAVTNTARNHRYDIQLYFEQIKSTPDDLCPGESRVFQLDIPTTVRGRVRLPRFGIRTLFPFELFRAWAWLHMDLHGLVYPQPAERAPAPPPTETARGHRQHDARGEEDFAGLRRFQLGDSPHHVAWKAYARSGDLLAKQFSGADTSSQWFDLRQVTAGDIEQRLSILTRWIVDAERTHADYGLKLIADEIAPANGAAHRHRCLEALALFDLAGEPRQ